MKNPVKVDGEQIPTECPRCESDNLCICNDEGMECMECGCWFETEPDGSIIWAYASHPVSL